MTKEFNRGDQIAYVPMHANGDITHEDVENGFVTSVRGDTVYCRYWSKITPWAMRTKANSEGASRRFIVHHVSVESWRVDEELAHIDSEISHAGLTLTPPRG